MKAVTVKVDPDMEVHMNKIRSHKNDNDAVVIKQAVYFTAHYIKDKDFFIMAEAKKRLEEMKQNPSIEKTEKELNSYLKKRGVKIE